MLSLVLLSVPPVAAAEGEPGTMPAGTMATPRVGHSASLLPDGRVLIVGGWADGAALATAELWDPMSRSFRPAGQLSQERTGHRAFVQPDGSVLVVGGVGGTGKAVVGGELWDPQSGTFAPAGALSKARFDATLTELADGRVLVVGGRATGGPPGQNGPALEAEVWDPATKMFGPAGSIPSKREGHTTIALPDGGAFIAGGSRSPEALRWDPVASTFASAGTMSSPRDRAALLVDGRVLTIGVDDPITCRPAGRYAKTPDAELWDPATSTFEPAGAFIHPRRPIDVVPLPEGGALVYGGVSATCMDVRRFPTAEAWEPGPKTFHRSGRTAVGREGHTATLLPDGRVAFIGGVADVVTKRTKSEIVSETRTLSETEVWSPVKRGFVKGPDLITARTEHSATLLPDGRILVVGGYARSELDTAELWTPPRDAGGSRR
jgi:hypothetical protein